MSERKRKEIKEYKVNEETRTVTVYANTLSDKAKPKINMYKEMEYKIVLLDKDKPKPRNKQRIGKAEMKKYLKDNIDSKIYNQLVKKLDSREQFFKIRQWLKEELQEQATKNKTKYVSANTIIQVAIANEQITSKENAIEYIQNNKVIPKEEITTEEN